MDDRTVYINADTGKPIKTLFKLVNKKVYDSCKCFGKFYCVLGVQTDFKDGYIERTLKIKEFPNNCFNLTQ